MLVEHPVHSTCKPALCEGPPAAESGVGKDLVRAALAGGIASSTSTLVLHPLDTLKTRIQVRLCLRISYRVTLLDEGSPAVACRPEQSTAPVGVGERCRHLQCDASAHAPCRERRERPLAALRDRRRPSDFLACTAASYLQLVVRALFSSGT